LRLGGLGGAGLITLPIWCDLGVKHLCGLPVAVEEQNLKKLLMANGNVKIKQL